MHKIASPIPVILFHPNPFRTFAEQFTTKGIGFIVQIIMARILLPEESMMCHYYTSVGFKVFAMDSEPMPEIALYKNEKKSNQEELNEIFGQDVLAKQYSNLLSY